MKNKIIIILAGITIILCMVLTLAFFQLHASYKLLNQLRVVKPGVHIDTIKGQLGKQMYENVPDLKASIKDPVFLQDKKCLWFYSGTPPCRVVEVYTDTNNIVLFVTWQGL